MLVRISVDVCVVRGKVLFSQVSVCSHLGRGYPYRSSVACTCYVAGGVPLAFTQEDFLVCDVFITTCVRSKRESTVFTGVCLLTFQGGTPSSWWGVPPSQVQVGEGVPPSSWHGGVPHPADGGRYPLPRSRWGVPHPANGGYPPSRGSPRQGYPPPPEQHRVYLLRGGRYASCVHAGGLSCKTFEFFRLELDSDLSN